MTTGQHKQAIDDMMALRASTGARFAKAKDELIQAYVALRALDHVTASPIAGPSHSEASLPTEDGELLSLLAHPVYAPRQPYRRLSTEINSLVLKLAESLSTAHHPKEIPA